MERISLYAGHSRSECLTKALNGYFKDGTTPKGKELAILPNMIPVREENKHITGITQFDAVKAVVNFFSEAYENISIVYALPGGDFQRVGEVMEFDTLGATITNLGDDDAKAKYGVHTVEVFDKDGNLCPLEISAIAEHAQLAVLCVPKNHDRSMFTGNVKNQMGLIVGHKGQMHNGHAFTNITYVLSQYNLTRLHEHLARFDPLYICDAFEAMEGNGPYGANMKHLGFGMVSKDAVALDSVAYLLMNELDHKNQVISPAEIAYLVMLNQKANQGNPQYGTLLQSIDKLFEYENLGTNINQEALINKMKQIGHLEAHREIKAQVEASRAIIEAISKDSKAFEHPEEIIRSLSD